MNIPTVSPKIYIEDKNLEKLTNSIIDWDFSKHHCWLWKDRNNQFYMRGQGWKANEIIYKIYNGSLPENHTVKPTVCKDCQCVNPEHMTLLDTTKGKSISYHTKNFNIREHYKRLIKFVEKTPEQEAEYLKFFDHTDIETKLYQENRKIYYSFMNSTAPGKDHVMRLQMLSEIKKSCSKKEIIDVYHHLMMDEINSL